jgi:hypothetical protein
MKTKMKTKIDNQPLNVIVMPIAEHRALHNHLNHMREAVLAS